MNSDTRRIAQLDLGAPAAREAVLAVVNAAAGAYRPVLGPLWREPYMPLAELEHDLAAGVEMHGLVEDGRLVAVMGFQPMGEVELIRHAYVRPERQGRGLGAALLAHLRGLSAQPMLVGTWAAADWAVRFYERHGFARTTPEETARLLARYWTVPADQAGASVVLRQDR